MGGRVRVERDGAIGWLVFDHIERRNAISVDMWAAIPAAVSELDCDEGVRVIVMRGAGDVAFVSGADISEFERTRTGDQAAEYDALNGRAFAAIGKAAKPVIAMIHGFCVGGHKWNGGGDGSGVFDETLREPFPWFKSGNGPGQTNWFPPRFDKPNDGVSREEQVAEGGLLHLVRGITNVRTEHPVFANGEFGEVLSDSHEWMVFERVGQNERYLVLINPTDSGKDYQFHEGWFPRYIDAHLVFWSDGNIRAWKDESENDKRIERKVFVPPYGFVLLKQNST